LMERNTNLFHRTSAIQNHRMISNRSRQIHTGIAS